MVARFEPKYLLMRGREGGTTDEGRAFFVPYDEIAYLRVEQVLKLGDLKKMYGETGYVDAEDRLGVQAEVEAAAAAEVEAKSVTPDTTTPPPAAVLPSDPASIAKQNLLDRIRAARAGAPSIASRPPKAAHARSLSTQYPSTAVPNPASRRRRAWLGLVGCSPCGGGRDGLG